MKMVKQPRQPQQRTFAQQDLDQLNDFRLEEGRTQQTESCYTGTANRMEITYHFLFNTPCSHGT